MIFLPLDHIKDLMCQSMSKSRAGIRYWGRVTVRANLYSRSWLCWCFSLIQIFFCSGWNQIYGIVAHLEAEELFLCVLSSKPFQLAEKRTKLVFSHVLHVPLFWSSLIVLRFVFSSESFLCVHCCCFVTSRSLSMQFCVEDFWTFFICFLRCSGFCFDIDYGSSVLKPVPLLWIMTIACNKSYAEFTHLCTARKLTVPRALFRED